MGIPVNWTYCPAGQWTFLGNQPAPFFHINVWSRDTPVQVSWRRWSDGPPFYSEGSGRLNQGQNTWAVPPAFVNTWWFRTESNAYLRLT
jgi:hypothetical protein